jgi:hypothetical protein
MARLLFGEQGNGRGLVSKPLNRAKFCPIYPIEGLNTDRM